MQELWLAIQIRRHLLEQMGLDEEEIRTLCDVEKYPVNLCDEAIDLYLHCMLKEIREDV